MWSFLGSSATILFVLFLSLPVTAQERLPGGWVITAGQEQTITDAVKKVASEVGGVEISSITIKGGAIEVTVNAGSETDIFTVSYNPDASPTVSVKFTKTAVDAFVKTKEAMQRNIPESLWAFVGPRASGKSLGDEGFESEAVTPGIMFWVYIFLILSGAVISLYLIYRFLKKKKTA